MKGRLPTSIYEELIFTNISNVLVNRVVLAIVALTVVTELTQKAGISFSVFALLQKHLQVMVAPLPIHAADFQNPKPL